MEIMILCISPFLFIYFTFDLIRAFVRVARKKPVSPKKAKKKAENKL